mgnify:CR=1 FL=1
MGQIGGVEDPEWTFKVNNTAARKLVDCGEFREKWGPFLSGGDPKWPTSRLYIGSNSFFNFYCRCYGTTEGGEGLSPKIGGGQRLVQFSMQMILFS